VKRVLFRVLFFLAVALPASPLFAQSVLNLEVRPGIFQKSLLLKPSGAPAASVILFAGGDGELGIGDDGKIETDGNFLVRSRDLFQKHGFVTAVVDMPNEVRIRDRYRLSDDHAVDIGKLIARLRQIATAPVWLVGTSRGTISVAHVAASLPPNQGPDGVVFSASVTRMSNSGRPGIGDAELAKIRVPALILHHRYDDCYVTPWSDQDDLLDDLKNAPKKELIGLEGGSAGSPGEECRASSYHGFSDIEEQAVAAIARWIKAATPVKPGAMP
jgi:hypothetical protein